MPIYTYRCRNCEHQFEQRQRMSDAPLVECPVCEGRIRRVVNSVGVVFKGKGFYVTDNRNGSSANGISKSGSEKKETSEETTTKESTGSAEKTESKNDSGQSSKAKKEKSGASA